MNDIKVQQTALFNTNIATVWSIITNNSEYAWREDIQSIDIIDDKNFIEIGQDGFQVHMIITTLDLHKLYEFEIRSKNINGQWSGVFKEVDSQITQVTFIEDVSTNKLVLKLFLKPYLRKQQNNYVSYLTKYIDELNKKK